jgi:alanine racemase
VWIKVDTGMHRLGFAPERFEEVYKYLTTKTAATQFVLMTHLANADDVNDKRTATQLTRLNKISQQYNLPLSIANSAGIVAWPKSHADIVRPGIMLYGSSPVLGKTAQDLDLKPVMTLSSRLIAIKQLRKGDHVGYGGEWVCPENMPVGVVSIGYGDGYPRHASAGTPVLVNGIRVPLIGRVSMDLITVDLRPYPQAKHGDTVTLWGEGLPADEIAAAAGTIAYQLFCGVAQRVEFQYVNG